VSAMSADELKRRARAGAVSGLNLVALRVQALAVPLTPLEYGDLRSSLVVTKASTQDLESSVSSDLIYAVPQHERMNLRHKVGGPKFLEKASLQVEAEQIMAAAAKRAMGA
jgi:hypothetical protein